MIRTNALEGTVLTALAKAKAVDANVEISTNELLKVNFSYNDLPLQIKFDGNLLLELPTIFIRNSDYLWGHPHISPKGDICISDRQGISFNPKDVDGVVEFVISSAFKIIEDARNLNASEKLNAFSNELQDYLAQRFEGRNRTLQGKFSTDGTYYIDVEVKGNEHSLNSISSTGQSVGNKKSTFHIINVVTTSIDLIPPMGVKPDINWLNSFLKNHPGLQLSSKRIGGLLIRVSNDFSHANFAITFVRDSKFKISQLNYYSVKELSADYYAQRGGSEISTLRVAIAGVGAIGSRVAEFLCMTGITNLHLIDNDFFSNDNIYRHVLGRRHAGISKVDALTNHLKSRFLDLNIKPVPGSLESFIESKIPEIDCLVLTTGNMVLERYIVKRAYQEKWPFQIVSGWVEALGLGGHAVSMNSHEKGCLECLHIIDGGAPGNLSRTSFIEPDQKVTKNLMGCIGFLPYSGMDAIKSAQLIVDSVLSQKTGYSLWVGPENNAIANDIRTSVAYKNVLAGKSKLTFTNADIYEGNCPCCNT